MKMGVSVRLLLSLLIAFPLLISAGHCAVFYLNSTVATANDTFWNDTDEYSLYLDYLNPYAQDYDDLRTDFLDDTDFGTAPDSTFLLDNFLTGNYTMVSDYSRKETISGQPYLVAVFNSTAGDLALILQRGTVWDVWENLTFINESYVGITCGGTASYYTYTDQYGIVTDCGASGGTMFRLKYYSGDGVDLVLYNQSWNGFTHNLNKPSVAVKTHLDKNEMGLFHWNFECSGFSNLQGLVYSNVSDYTWKWLTYQGCPDDVLTRNETYRHLGFLTVSTGIGAVPSWIYFRLGGAEGNYRSVALPICDDIALGNTQTDFYFDSPYWYRKCSGIIPTGETFSCDLGCAEYGDTYTLYNKSVATGLIPSSAVSYSNYASIISRADGHGYIFDSGADLSDVRNLRVYTWLEFQSANATEKFGISGWTQLGTVPSTFGHITPYSLIPSYNNRLAGIQQSCYTGQHNVTEYSYWSYPLLPEQELPYIPVQDQTYYLDRGFDWLTLNAYINVYADFSVVSNTYGCDSQLGFPTSTPINSTATKLLEIYATWENVTQYNTSCIEYEAVCIPTVPEGYSFDEDDIICVGLSCYVEAFSDCNNDGVCNEPYETSVSCPADCETPTGSEIVDATADAVGNLIDSAVSFIAQAFGISETLAKGLIWMAVTIVVGGVMVGVGGMMGSVATYLAMMLIGTMIGWMPFWIGVIFIVLTGFVLAKTVSDFVRGG